MLWNECEFGVKAEAKGPSVEVEADKVDSVESLFSLITRLIMDVSSSPYLQNEALYLYRNPFNKEQYE